MSAAASITVPAFRPQILAVGAEVAQALGLRVEAGEYREVDDERILVIVRLSGRGKTSGLDLAQVPTKGGAGLFHVRRGQVTRYVIYWDRDRAFADLGLKG